jgi:hypothetical protein
MSIISANATGVLWFGTANAPRFAKGSARVIESDLTSRNPLQ